MNSSVYYDQDVAIAALVTAVSLVPVNCLLLAALLYRRSFLTNPITWLFINITVFDSFYLVSKSIWFYEQNLATTPLRDCQYVDLFLRLAARFTENISNYTTAGIALFRAASVRRSTRNLKTCLTKKQGLVVLSIIWSLGVIGLIILINVNQCRRLKKCANGLIPMSGYSEEVHDMLFVILTSSTVIIAYTYVCLILFRCRRSSIASATSHTKTIVILIVYLISYTALTLPAHLYAFILDACPPEFAGEETKIDIDVLKVLMALLPLGSSGFNPLLLYALSGAIRQSVDAIVIQFRECTNGTVVDG